jgi:hypothetical protein
MENSPSDYAAVTKPKGCNRSRVTNGHALLPDLPGIDGRSAWVRRCKDLIADHLADLGGHDNCSNAERSIIRRIAVISTELEMLEAKFAAAGHATPADLETYQRCANTLRRLLEAVHLHDGLARRARDVTEESDIRELNTILHSLEASP